MAYKSVEDYIIKNPDYSGGWIPGNSGLGFITVAPGYVQKVRTQAAGAARDYAQAELSIAQKEKTEKETNLLGRPKQSVSTTSFSGPAPTMGDLSTFNMPTRPETPEFTMPEMGEMPEFVAPEYDEAKIAKMAQQNAAPGVRNLRTAIQAVTSRRSDNPNVDRMTLRDALAGYGQGLEEVMSGARQSASAEYAQKYAMEYRAAGMNWEQAVQTVRDKYAGAMEGRKMEYQAEMDAVNQVYAASVQAESQRVAAENQKVMSIFDAAMQKYIAGATKTTTESYQGVTFDTKGNMMFGR